MNAVTPLSIIVETALVDKDKIFAAADKQLQLYEHGWVRFRIDELGGGLWRLSRVSNGGSA